MTAAKSICDFCGVDGEHEIYKSCEIRDTCVRAFQIREDGEGNKMGVDAEVSDAVRNHLEGLIRVVCGIFMGDDCIKVDLLSRATIKALDDYIGLCARDIVREFEPAKEEDG